MGPQLSPLNIDKYIEDILQRLAAGHIIQTDSKGKAKACDDISRARGQDVQPPPLSRRKPCEAPMDCFLSLYIRTSHGPP